MNRTLFRAVFAVIAAVSFYFRLRAALYTDFWLDEVWNWTIAHMAPSAFDIIFRIHEDTNHILNTLFIYGVGDRLWWPVYRLPALSAGAGSVVLMGAIGRRYGRWESLTAALLAGFSFMLVTYSSEARGYACVVFFALSTFYLTGKYLEQNSKTTHWLWAMCIVLGFLSHFNFLHCYLGIAAWSAYRMVHQTSSRKNAADHWARFHAPVWPFLIVLYFTQIRHIIYGGGAPTPVLKVLGDALTALLGAPEHRPFEILLTISVVTLMLFELLRLYREGSDGWVFYAVILLISPAMFVVMNPAGFFYPRYFLVNLVFLLLLISRPLTPAQYRSAPMKAICALALLSFVWGNGLKIHAFSKSGRGQYLEAVRFMAERTPGESVTVGSDHDFAYEMMLRFYARFLPPDKRIVYLRREKWIPKPPEWAFIHSSEADFTPPMEQTAFNGSRYSYQETFPYYGLSGLNWTLYRLKKSS